MKSVISSSFLSYKSSSPQTINSLFKCLCPLLPKQRNSSQHTSFVHYENGSPSRMLERIFVNQDVNLQNIKFYGFDMDYTLAEYKSPQYERLGFNLVKERLVTLGYPQEIMEFEYDPSFPVRGLWFDKLYGNLLKVDAYGNILVCVHGFKSVNNSQIKDLYPNQFLHMDKTRLYVLDTHFNLPEVHMYASLIDFFINSPQYVQEATGLRSRDSFISYKSMFQDIRNAVDWVHRQGDLKSKTIENLDEYVKKDERLMIFLTRIRESGAKVFLLTNSEYTFTDKIMTYLFDFPYGARANEPHRNWKTYFDAIVVDAQKPLFFGEGMLMRQVDTTTGALKTEIHKGPLLEEQVYSGGSCDIFTKLIGAKGNDVLYIGDNVFSDILKPKKREWKTFLVVPELIQELNILAAERKTGAGKEEDQEVKMTFSGSEKGDMVYGIMGSPFRSGLRQTFFSSQVVRYADLYSPTVFNLMYYPFEYMFRAPFHQVLHCNNMKLLH